MLSRSRLFCVSTLCAASVFSGVALSGAQSRGGADDRSTNATSTQVVDLGTVPAAQAAQSLGVGIAPQGLQQDWQFAAAKAMGASWVRMQCSWAGVEHQSAPPANTPAQPSYVQDSRCVPALNAAAKYGLHVTETAAYGPPFHLILYATLPQGGRVGDTSLTISPAAGVGGDTLNNLHAAYNYICPVTLNDDGFAGQPYRCSSALSSHISPPGTLITNAHVLSSTKAVVDLASALDKPQPPNITAPNHCSMDPRSAVLNCPGAHFDATWDHSVQVRVPGAGPRGGDLTTYVAAVQSPEQLVLRRSATAAVPDARITANRLYAIGEILYPSTATNKPQDPSVNAYADYVTFLAQDMAQRGVSGDVELWNEPPWRGDSWDFRPGLYDSGNPGAYRANATYPKGAAVSENGQVYLSLADGNRGNAPATSSNAWSSHLPSNIYPGQGISGANFGFVANLQHRTFPSHVTVTWNGTSGNGTTSLLGSGMRANSGEALIQPATLVTRESFHPYAGPLSNPEEAMMVPGCLHDAARSMASGDAGRSMANIYANGRNCYLPGESQSANLMQAVEYDFAAKVSNPSFGIGHSITETNNIPPGPGFQVAQARSNLRQFLGFASLGISPIEFFQFWDGAHRDPTFSFVDYDGASMKKLPSYSAFVRLMTDLHSLGAGHQLSGGVTGMNVSQYQGTYPLAAVQFTGTRNGASRPSTLLALWQLSVAPGFKGSLSGNTLQVTTMNSGWNTLGPNQVLQGGGIPPNTTISAMLSGNGGVGTYRVSGSPASVGTENMGVNWYSVPSPAPGTATLLLPAGMRVTTVVNLVTGAPVPHKLAGQILTVQVTDDPVEVLADPQ